MSDYIHNIRSEKFEVIASGSFITFDNEPTVIEIGDKDEALKIIINFEDNESEKLDLKVELISNLELKFILTNFKSTIGSGTVKPIPIGTHNEKDLFISFAVYKLNDSTEQRTIHYTFHQKI